MIEDRPRHGGSYDLVPPGRMPIHVLLERKQCQRIFLTLLHLYAMGISSREVDKSKKTTLRDLVILRDLANAYHPSYIA